MKMKASGRRPFFYGWWIVIVSMVSMSASPYPFVFASLGLFMKPFGTVFGWSRAQVSACIAIFTVTLAVSLPLVGRLIDRYGVRRILLPSMFFLAFGLLSIPLFVTEIWQLAVAFCLMGTLGAATNTVGYVPVISAWFDKHRGLALGISMSGIGIGVFYVPPLVEFLIDKFSWRAGYFGLSAVILFITIPLVAYFLKESPSAMNLGPDGAVVHSTDVQFQPPGLTAGAAVRTGEFWLLLVAFAVVSFVLNGLMAHLVPMLTDRGMPAPSAALVASSVGISVFISRIGIGHLVDRLFAPRVAAVFFVLSTIGVLVYALGARGEAAFLGALLIGLSLGGELALMAYMTSRYFGLRSFASIFGIQLAGTVCGAGIAPLLFALWFESFNSYVGILFISVILSLVAVLNMILMGPYPKL